jgi:Holliday junction resolvasome RuvABC ATP-dependent DNA helicase subunit
MSSGSDSSHVYFATCKCQHCNGGIEFDTRNFDKGETRCVECPHCHGETLIFVRTVNPPHDPPSIPPLVPQPLAKNEASASDPAKRHLPPTVILLSEPEDATSKSQEIVGQKRVLTRLTLAFEAAAHRSERMPHTLLVGASGSGTTTFAIVIAKGLGKLTGKAVVATKGSVLKSRDDLAMTLTALEEDEVLLIIKIDQLPKNMAELLRNALEHSVIDVAVGEGPNARGVRLNLPRFTLIATATRKEQIPPALLASFPIVECMDAYSTVELAAIASGFAAEMKIHINDDAAIQIACAGCETPKDVFNRLRHVRDFACVNGSPDVITADIVAGSLKLLQPVQKTKGINESRSALSSEVRREVWRRDGGKCVKCGSRERLEYDHIIPVALGGSNTARNIELLCEACNRSKSDSIQ